MDLQKLMQQAQKMQNDMAKIEEELAATVYTGNSSGVDGVTIKLNGHNEVLEVTIAEELMDKENREMLQDMVLVAFNDAQEKVAKDREEKLGSITQGVNFPGM